MRRPTSRRASASGGDSDTLVPAIDRRDRPTARDIAPGGSATYTIVVTNGGPSNAANVTALMRCRGVTLPRT
jgi:hypothetical protein